VDIDLSGKTALVTGSTQGIGLAIAEALAGSGARVAVNGRTAQRVEEAVAKLGGDVVGVAVDVTTEEGAAQLLHELPAVDILVNNLGIFGAVPAREITDEQWRQYFDVNVLAAVRLIRMYLPGMIERGWGRAIQIASDSALVTPEEMIHYGVSKTALLAVSRGFAKDAAGTGVTVNSVIAGPTHTAGVEDFVYQLVDKSLRGTTRVHAQASPTVTAPAAHRTCRNREHGRVFGVAAGLRNDWGSTARRRRIRGFDRAVGGRTSSQRESVDACYERESIAVHRARHPSGHKDGMLQRNI
jgi:NAD(P)-dependent dehydrogenase (short-subunit alcohol dehydrogenase family)